MATLITGGTGFVGTNVAHELAGAGDDVVLLHRSPVDDLARHHLADLTDRIVFAQVDIRDTGGLAQVAARKPVEHIVHTAAVTANSVAVEKSEFRHAVEVNIVSTLNVLELARSIGARRVVHVSSGTVYPQPAAPHERQSEEGRLEPRGSLYGITKYAAERLAIRYAELFGVDLRVVRLTGPYGPMERRSGSRSLFSAPWYIVRAALRGEEILVESETEVRDWTYVVDTARAIRFLLESESPHHQVYNMSCGEAYTLLDLLAAVRDCLPNTRWRTINPGEAPATGTVVRLRPVPMLDASRLLGEGFRVKYPLPAGVATYVDWCRKALDKGILDW